MTKLLIKTFIAAIIIPLSVGASLPPNDPCPDLEGDYEEEQSRSPLTMTSTTVDGIAQFTYAGDVWVADNQKRDPQTGTRLSENSDCFSQVSCSQKILTRHWECSGAKNDEYYSLDANGEMTIVYQGNIVNTKLKYRRR